MRFVWHVCAVSVPVAVATAAWAQAAAPTPSPARVAKDTAAGADALSTEIIVTARRREESLSKVPISITAFGSEQLASRTIRSEQDLQAAVPGLVIRQNGSANAFNYVLRGQTIDTYTNSPPGVLPYIDEAQVVTRSASTFYDLGNIQVLKGPQGTLFGRNATGGAVLYQTARVDDDFGGYLRGRIGNYDAYQIEGALNLPIAEGIRLRLAGTKVGGGAFVQVLNQDRNVSNLEQRSFRATLELRPVEGLINTTVAQHTRDGGTNTPGLMYHSSAFACGNGRFTDTSDCLLGPSNPSFVAYAATHPYIFPGGVVAYANMQDERGPWKAEANTPLSHRAKSDFAINTTTYEVSPTLTVKNIFMINKTSSDELNDYDGSSFPINSTQGTFNADFSSQIDTAGFITRTKQLSDELQLTGKVFDDRLTYTAGAYYLNESTVTETNLYFSLDPAAAPALFAYRARNSDHSRALFAQGTYALNDWLNLTGGFRYTWDKVGQRQLPGSLWTFFLPAANPYFPQSSTFRKPSWNVSLDYRVTPDLLVYATTRGSWRAGGYNYTLLPSNTTARFGGNLFLPETTKDVEVGVKYNGRSLGVPITLNVSVFNQWVDDVQRAANIPGFAGSPTLVTSNVPKAEISGLEADASVRPVRWLNLGGSLAYTDARYTSNRVDFDPSFSSSVLFYGPYADVPKWSGSAYAEITHDLGADRGALVVRGDVYAQSRMYFSNIGRLYNPGSDIAGYALVNGRVSWNDIMGSKVALAFFARNILNQRYYAGGNPTGGSLGYNVAYPGQPRMYAVEARVNF